MCKDCGKPESKCDCPEEVKAKERAEMNSTRIQSGQMTPNEARGQDELNPYPDGDQYWMAGNIQPIRKALTQAEQE